MSALDEKDISCPYCAEMITVLIDCSVEQQQYIEDCQVCCCPIHFDVALDGEGFPLVQVKHENDC